MRILPPAQRDAMYQVYAFCRAVDDIADSDLPRAERDAGLERWRADIDACYAGSPRASLLELTRHIHTFHLQREDFHAMIDGMAMDAAADICAPDEATLDLYCDRVASAAGRLSVRIFGMEEQPGIDLSHHLGRALQLTNILRDIDEDAEINRCYLPYELLAREGIAATNPLTIADDPSLPRVCATLAERAKQLFAAADAIMDAQPRAQVKAPRIMSGVYRLLLERTLERGFDIPRTKVSKPKLRMLAIVARYAFF
jgi:phytoene synthase